MIKWAEEVNRYLDDIRKSSEIEDCIHLFGEWFQVSHVSAAVSLQDETEPHRH